MKVPPRPGGLVWPVFDRRPVSIFANEPDEELPDLLGADEPLLVLEVRDEVVRVMRPSGVVGWVEWDMLEL